MTTDNTIQIHDEYSLDFSRELVWEKLNDPEILAACINGCEFVERASPQKFKAVIRARLGEFKKDFKIDLDVDDRSAPAEYGLSSIVSAGILGKMQGQADVSLKHISDNKSELSYIAKINGGGVLGKALPLIEGAAIRRVRAFFDAFVAHLDA